MRKLRTPHLPETRSITDPATAEYAEALNVELDNLRIDLNRYIGKMVYFSITEATTLVADDETVLCNGTFAVTLPSAASSPGKVYTIKNIGSGSITITGDETESIPVLASQYDFVTVFSDETVWWPIGRYIQ